MILAKAIIYVKHTLLVKYGNGGKFLKKKSIKKPQNQVIKNETSKNILSSWLYKQWSKTSAIYFK